MCMACYRSGTLLNSRTQDNDNTLEDWVETTVLSITWCIVVLVYVM